MPLTPLNILLRHNYIEIPNDTSDNKASTEAVGTVLMNLSYYGYALNVGAYRSLLKLSHDELSLWWKNVEHELKDITGDNRKIDAFVVYKNFPAEVLEKTVAEYWIPQILVYWGFPSELFTQEVKPREDMNERRNSLVLRRAKKETLGEILDSYLRVPARWKEQEQQDVMLLIESLPFSVEKISFKENLVNLAKAAIEAGKYVRVSTATDVLRLASGLSDGDVSLRENTKFISFKKPVRRFLLNALEDCSNLAGDVARRPEMWKRFLHQLHPGDFKTRYEKVCAVANELYHDRLVTFNSQIEAFLKTKDAKVLALLAKRPGEFRRRLIHVLDIFGDAAVESFIDCKVLEDLTLAQVVSLRAFLASVNNRLQRVFPPSGNWNKLQIGEARWVEAKHIEKIVCALGQELKRRVPKVKMLSELTKLIKLPNNGEVSPFARGTTFLIPQEVKFIRTASYWKIKTSRNTWFDNGWNFFDKDWKSIGSCCWNAIKFGNGAVFSGDPTNSNEMQGRAAQLIDLYPDELVKQGARYAVWNILCFSNIPFSDAEDVFAALQWGKDSQKGKLFEPSRCQLSFPLKSKQMTKYICLIDLETRQMVYLDANLHGNVQSAANNGTSLEKNMPPFVEYINSLPSVYDLFCESVSDEGNLHVLYSDAEIELKDVEAYVFKPENKDNKYTSFGLNRLLS